ncbi:MAG: hypothetical protein ACJARL_001552 [Halopseudomonas sp.]|jgi:hypothetical protein
MELVYAVTFVVGTLTVVSVVGYFVAKHLDKKYGTELKQPRSTC